MNTNNPIIDFLGKNAFEKHLEAIKKEYDRVCSVRDRLQKRLQSWNGDAEVQNAYKKVEECRRLSLQNCSEMEIERMTNFRNQHYEKCHNGNCYQYELLGTEIGVIIKIRCPDCGQEEDVTDYESW